MFTNREVIGFGRPPGNAGVGSGKGHCVISKGAVRVLVIMPVEVNDESLQTAIMAGW